MITVLVFNGGGENGGMTATLGDLITSYGKVSNKDEVAS